MENGFTQIPNSILVDSRLTPYEKIIYCVIRMHCIDKDNCWPSLTTISKESGASRPTVVSTIKKLETVGLITKTKEDGKDSNVYTIINKWLNNLTSKPALLVKQVNHTSKGDLLPLVKEVNSNNIKKNNIKEKYLFNEGKKAPTRPKKQTDPRIKVLFDHYFEEYKRIYNEKPYISGGKEAKIFERMLKSLSASEIKTRMTKFFDDPLDRLQDPHHSIPLFESMINKYSENRPKKKTWQEIALEEYERRERENEL